MNAELLHNLIIYQKKYFEIIDDFFTKFVGKEVQHFSDFDSVALYLKSMYENNKNNIFYFSRLNQIRSDFLDDLISLYKSESAQAFRSAQELDTFKVNLGGSSRFLATQLNAVRKSLLLTDVVLIPDPILPWVEKDRSEEKLKNIRMIEAIYFVLHLKDLLEEGFEVPPFFIFPSWEKILEENDKQTKENLNNLLFEFLSFYLNYEINSENDLIKYLSNNPADFLRKVEEKSLFISPNGAGINSLKEAIVNYKNYAIEHRTKNWCDEHLVSDIHIVVNGIAERLVPQFHLFENAMEMKSNPYLCLPEHAHYYNLISKMSWSFRTENIVDKQTDKILQVLCAQQLDFLVNINDDELKMLRKSDEHILFKNEMRGFINSISTSKVEDINYVIKEFSDFLDIRIKRHINDLEVIKRKYRVKNIHTLMLAGGTLAVNFAPLLGQFMSVLGAGSVGMKYLGDKLDEKYELQKANSSYMGVIALAKTGK
ncbi:MULTISPECIES: hypothetical protein [Acinetobacter]|uniref:hypothetical protein n=1 Tax=Acinetobacter TaxID=469 RepID=UPI00124F97D7|nr:MULTISPECIES: hypothetical protein [Acinetobacter]MDQ9834634.1 hypothetical protein [Acinetobacter soli]